VITQQNKPHQKDAGLRRRLHRAWTISALLLCFIAAGNLHAQSAFPATSLASTSTTQTVTVTLPTGGTVQTIEVLTLGAPSLDFQQAGTSGCSGASFTASQTCSVPVQFSPLAPGVRAGAVVLIGSGNTVLGTQYIHGVGNGGLGIFLPGTASTFAGNGGFTSLGDGGAATAAGLKLPYGIAVDGAGNAYIADSGEYRIRRVDAATHDISTYAGNGTESYTGDGGPATSATMGTPVGIALDGAGNLYFADSTEHVVRKVDAVTQTISTVAGTGTHGSSGDGGPATSALLYAPYGVTLDASGNLFIADTANARIRRVDAVTHIITTVAGDGSVSATLGDGGPATSASLNQPYGVAFDPAGDLYIADAGNNRIRRVDATTLVITTAAGNGTAGFAGDSGDPTQAELYFPSSITFDPAGNLYIADTQNNRIRKIDDNIIYTFLGNGNGKYGGDGGSALLAGIYGPYFVYLDANGDLFVGDYFDNRIREVASNVVTLTYPNAIRVGQVSPPQDEDVENDGNAPLIFSSITPDANAADDPGTTTCLTATALAIGEGCVVGAEFAPTQVGSPLVGNIVLSGTPLDDLSDTPMTIMVVGQSLALNTTDVTLISSLNPSDFGQSVSFIATVSSGTGTPTGTVTYKDGTTTLGTATLTASSTATYTTTALAVGPHSITAIYAGDSEHSGSTSAALTQVVKSSTETTLSASANPSTVNSSITFTAHVAQNSGSPASPATTPTGTVIFNDGSTTLGTGTLDANGNATLATTALPVGSQSITANYTGDTYNLASTSAALSESITQQQTATALTSGLNPAVYGNAVVLTAAVTVSGTGPATGQVVFFDGSGSIGSGTLDGSGHASLTNSTLATGSHSLTAHYAGDTNNAPSVSSAIVQIIQQATTSDTLAATPTPVIAGKTFTLSATIADVTGAGAATGTVSFHDGSTSLGTGGLNGSGVASVSPILGPGTQTLTSTYAGDTNHAGSNGTLSITVAQATTTVTIAATPNPSTLGQTVTFTITVSGNGGVPGGTVTLLADGTALGTTQTLNNGTATVTSAALAVGAHSMTATYSGDINDAASSTSTAFTQTVQKSSSTVSVAASPNPVVSGNSVTFTATVHGTTGNPTPTGTVQFVDGSTNLGNGTVTAGVATFSTSALTPGQHTISANYGGDGNYNGSSATVTEGVQRTTTATLTSNSNPAIAGTSITFTMQVTGTGATPTGTITLLDGSSTLAIRSLDGTGTATYTTAALAAGTHLLTASYAGDTNNGPATSSVLTEQVNQASTATTLAAAVNPSIAGKALVLTASVTGNGGTPTGHVNFFAGTQALGSGTLNSSGVATLSTAALAPGSYSLTAVYAGDTNDGSSTSLPVAEAINQAATTTVLTANPNPAIVTHSVQLTATVSGNGGTPSGTVVFAAGATTLASVPLPASGIATYATTALPLGSDALTASYSGDANDGASQGTLLERVSQASPTIALASSANPAQVDASVTFTATASSTAGTAGGVVTFLDGGAAIGTANLTANSAALTLSSLTLGVHSITASYAGDADNAAAQSSALTETIQQSTTTQLSAAPNPSLAGKPVTLSATVVGANGSAPSGTVTFKDGASALGTGALTAGQATLTTSTLSIGTHALIAIYSGDSLDTGSTSSAVSEVVQSAGTSTALSTSGSPALYGATVTFTAAVTGSGTTPAGSVTFKDGNQTLGTSILNPNGQAIYSTNTLAAGSHSITASYAGDADNQPSISGTLTQVIQAQTTTTLVPAPPTAIATTAVVLTAQVGSNAGTKPGGTVSFLDGGTVLGTATLNQSGTATLSVTTLAAGNHALDAVYAGDALDAGSTSTPVTESIQPIPTTSHLGLSASNVLTGQPLTLIAAVTSSYAAPFTGTVSFNTGSTVLGQSSVNSSGSATLAPVLAVGTYSITASYSGDAYNAPSTSAPVTVTVGQAADFSMTLSSTALTMASKQNTTITMTISSLGGFTDTLGLGCASLPRLVTCTFSKDMVTLAANGTASVQLTVDTASPLTSGGVSANTPPGSRLPVALGWLLPGGALLGWLAGGRRRRWSRWMGLILAATAISATFSLSGCNGLSSNGAAPGSYTFQVTAYGNTTGVQHSVDLSLKVTQ
jgi:hypothetical protein